MSEPSILNVLHSKARKAMPETCLMTELVTNMKKLFHGSKINIRVKPKRSNVESFRGTARLSTPESLVAWKRQMLSYIVLLQ